MGFYFDPTNFGLGFGAGVLSSLAGYRAVQAIRRMSAAQERRIRGSARAYAQRSGNRRYLAELVDLAERAHLAGKQVPLSQILVEPRFIRMPEIISPPEEDVERNVFENVPTLHDYPYLHAPFNLPTLSIGDLGKGESLIAILGLPGSGRTTALMSIALWSIGKLEFKPERDVVQAQIDAEEAALSAEERAERIKERIRMAQQSRERLTQRKGAEDSETAADLERSRLRSLLPFYAHLANLNLRETASGSTDPAEPLARAIQAHVGRIAAKAVPAELYRALQHKRALVLLDGYDEIPEEEQAEARAWLRALFDHYGENFFILTATPTGYHWMMEAGVVPVFLRPWNDENIRQCAVKWAQRWSSLLPEAPPVAEQLIVRATLSARADSALEATTRIWGMYADEEDTEGSKIDSALRMLLPDYDGWLPHLRRMAALQLDEGYITLRRLIQLDMAEPLPVPGQAASEAAAAIPGAESSPWVDAADEQPTPATDDDELFRALPIASAAGDTDAAAQSQSGETRNTKPVRSRRQAAATQARLLRILLRAGLLRQYRNERYLFAQPQIAAYLAAGTLEDVDTAHLLQKASLPRWQAALAYAASTIDLEPALRARLQQEPDVSSEYLLAMTQWLRYAQADAPWRAHLLRLLGNMLVAPNQFSITRERIAAALIGAHDAGTLVIFRRMVQDANPELRRLGCIGLGALRDASAVPILLKFIQQDADDVKIAAALALGAIGNEEALDAMAQAMVSSPNRAVRRIIAETLAADPEQGYPTLYDAIREGSDIMLRRAALFGLGRVKTPWALIIINEVLNDPREEYFVRSAAEEVFRQLYEEELQGAQGYPPLGALPWLLEWATRLKSEGRIDSELSGLDLLLLAMEQDEDLMVRLLATITAGQMGIPQAAGHLYASLQHPEPAIRDSAYRALSEMQQQYGVPLPAPA